MKVSVGFARAMFKQSSPHQRWGFAVLHLILPLALLAGSSAQSAVVTKAPPPEILGVRLAMPYQDAHAQLAKLGQLKNEEEGQEVWTLLGDEHYELLIVSFDGDRKVRYVTAMADANGTPITYAEVGDTSTAIRSGDPGNLTFTWKGEDRANKFEYVAIAKGKDAQRLSTFSVKVGAKVDQKD